MVGLRECGMSTRVMHSRCFSNARVGGCSVQLLFLRLACDLSLMHEDLRVIVNVLVLQHIGIGLIEWKM